MFWNKKKDKKGNDDCKSNRSGNSGKDKNAGAKPTRVYLMQKMFSDGCDKDFVYYDE